MPLTLRPTGLASPAYQHLEDWTILEDGREVGRMYEDGSASTPVQNQPLGLKPGGVMGDWPSCAFTDSSRHCRRGARDDFEQMTVKVLEIDATATVVVIDFT